MAATNRIQLTVDILTALDEARAKGTAAQLDAVFDDVAVLDVGLNLDRRLLDDFLADIANEHLEVPVTLDLAASALSDVEQGLKQLDVPTLDVPEVHLPPIELPPLEVPPVEIPPPDTDSIADSYDELFKKLSVGIEKNRKAMAAMIAQGDFGSPDFTELLGATVDAQHQLDDLADAKKRVDQIMRDGVEVKVEVPPANPIKELADSFESLSSEAASSLDQQTKALAAMGADGKHESAEYEELKARIISAREESERLSESLDQAKKETGQIDPDDDSATNLQAKAEALGNLGEKLTSFAEKGNEVNATLKKVSAQTGAYGTELDRIESAGYRAFKVGVGENVSEAIAAIGIAKQQLGGVLDDSGIESFVQSAGGIAKIYDKEIGEVVGKSRTLIKSFGLDGKEAGNLVAFAMQGAGNGMDDVLDTLDEYSPIMKQAGLSAQEFTGILVAGVQAGTRDTDKLGDSIKESLLRVNSGDATNALKGITGPVSETIQGMVKLGEQGKKSVIEVMHDSATEIERAFSAGEISESIRQQLQVAISGAPAEDLSADLWGKVFSEDIDPSLIEAKAALAGKQISDAIKPTGLGDSIKRELDAATTSVASFAAPVADAAGTVLSGLSSIGPGAKFAMDAVSGIGTAFPGIAKAATSAMSVMTGPVGIGLLAATVAAIAIPAIISWLDPIEQLKGQMEDTREAFDEWNSAVEQQASVNKQAQALDDLTAQYERLSSSLDPKDQKQAAAIADEIARSAPEAVDGLRSIELQGGKTASALSINVSAARELADEQRKLAAETAAAAKETALDELGGLFAQLDEAKGKIADQKDDLKELKALEADGKGEAVGLGGVLDFDSVTENRRELQKEIGENAKLSKEAEDQIRASIAAAQDQGTSITEIAKTIGISEEQVRKYGDASKEAGIKALSAFGPDKVSAADNYAKIITQTTSKLEEQRAELVRLEEQQKSKGGSDPELARRIEQQKALISQTGNALKTSLDQGRTAGLGTERQIKQVAKALGTSESEARGMVQQIKAGANAAADGGNKVDQMADSFTSGMERAQAEVDKLQSAYAEMIRTGDNDPSIIENLRRARQELKTFTDAEESASETEDDRREKELDRQEKAAERARRIADRGADADQRRSRARIRLMADEGARRLAEIDLEERIAIKHADIETQYYRALPTRDGEDHSQDIADAKAKKQDATDAATAAREELRAELAQKNLDRYLSKLASVAEKEALLDTDRLNRMKAAGARSSEALQQQKDLELDIIRKNAERQRQTEIESTAEFDDYRTQLLADIAAAARTANTGDDISPEEAARRLKAKREEIAGRLRAGTDPIARAFQTITQQQLDEEGRVSAEADFSISEARIRETVTNAAEREFQLRKLAADKQLAADLKAAGANAVLKAQAQARYDTELAIATEERAIASITSRADRTRRQETLEARRAYQARVDAAKGNTLELEDAQQELDDKLLTIDRKYYRESSLLAAAAFAVEENLYKAFLSDLTDARRDELQRERDDLARQVDEIVKSYQDGTVELEGFFDGMEDLRQQQLENERALAEERMSIWDQLNKGGSAAAASLREAWQASYDAQVQAAGKAAQKQGLFSQQGLDSLESAAEEALALVVATTAQAGFEGQNTLKTFLNASLDATLKLLAAESTAIVALIFGKSVAENPILGALAAGALTAAFYGLASIAKNAIANAKFEEGGLVEDTGGPRLILVNDDPRHRPEFVVKGSVTEQYTAELQRLNAGIDPRLAFGISGYDDPMVREQVERIGEAVQLSTALSIDTAGRLVGFGEMLVDQSAKVASIDADIQMAIHSTERMHRRAMGVSNSALMQTMQVAARIDSGLRDVHVAVATQTRELTQRLDLHLQMMERQLNAHSYMARQDAQNAREVQERLGHSDDGTGVIDQLRQIASLLQRSTKGKW